MGLLPERQYRRLNRARLDSSAVREWEAGCRALARRLHAGHARFGDGDGPDGLRRSAQILVDHLSERFLVPTRAVILEDQPRPHRRNRAGRVVYEVHGECDPRGPMRVFLRTAAREQPVALKTFLNTLCHEWVHHYDFLAFGQSVHCSGFYQRLALVERPLKGAVDRLARGRP